MSKLSERQRLILTVAVTVIICGSLLGLVLKDRGEIEVTNEEVAQLDTEIRLADREIQKIKEREETVLVYRAVEERELQVLPTRQAIANFHRDLSTFISQAGLKFQDLPDSTPQESSLAKGIFVTQTVLTCRGDSTSLLKFLNMIENDERLVAIKGLKLKAGSVRNRDVLSGPIEHDVTVNLESYFYNPSAGKPQTWNKIPGEEARLQEKGIRDTIAAFQPERPDTYLLRPATSRRDPLVDPRRARPTEDPADLAETLAREEVVVLELERRVDEIYEKKEHEEALINSMDLFRRDRVAQEIDELLDEVMARLSQIEQMKEVTVPEMLTRLDTVRARLKDLQGSRPRRVPKVTREVAQKAFDDLEAEFDLANYDDVVSTASQWVLYTDGKEIVADAQSICDEIRALRDRARTLGEFDAFKFTVTGTIVHPASPGNSIALINGHARKTGDRLDERGEVIVGRIARDRVQFVYKGESIHVRRSRGGEKSERGKSKVHASARRN